MSRSPARFTQAEIGRAIKAVQKAGLTVGRIEIGGNKIVVLTANEAEAQPESALDEWRKKRDAREAKRH